MLRRCWPGRQRRLQRDRRLCLDANWCDNPPNTRRPAHRTRKLTNSEFCAGNTIFLALGASGYPPNTHLLWLRAIVSISAFWFGCFFFSRARHFHPRRKVVLSFFFLLQGMFIVAAAALAQTNTVPAFGWAKLPTTLDASLTAVRTEHEEEARTLLPLALLAFQFGGQIVASRVLGYNEIPTNVLTSLYCDLLSDPLLVAGLRENPKRNRRIAAIFLTVGGGIGGGWLQRSAGGMGSALWIAAAIKIAIAVAWLAWGSNIKSPTSLRAEKTAVSVNQQVV